MQRLEENPLSLSGIKPPPSSPYSGTTLPEIPWLSPMMHKKYNNDQQKTLIPDSKGYNCNIMTMVLWKRKYVLMK
jgi:hypothetical protein